MDKTIPVDRTELDELLSSLSIKLKEVFPDNDCYFIGTSCVDNIEKSDIDFTVLYESPICVTELRLRTEQVKNIDERLQIMFTFTEDQQDIKDYPYVSMQDLSDRNIDDRENYTEEEYANLKKSLYELLWRKKNFNKAIIRDEQRKEMRKKTIAEKIEYLKTLND